MTAVPRPLGFVYNGLFSVKFSLICFKGVFVEGAFTVNDIFNKLIAVDGTLKLTELRKDVLKIFIQAKNPISAYDVLDKLKKKRESAEPPTVYRVIEYFVDKHVLHRIDAENKYVFCTQLDHPNKKYHGIIFLCNSCHSSTEVMDNSYADFLNKLSRHHHFQIDNSVIEIKGVCEKCAPK